MRRQALTIAAAAILFALIFTLADSAPRERPADSALNGLRIGFVDMPAVTEQSQYAQSFKEQINLELYSKIEPFLEMQKELEEMQRELDKQRIVLSDSEIAIAEKKQEELAAKMEREKVAIEEYRQAADLRLSSTFDRILEAVGIVAKQEGYDMVFRRDSLLFGSANADITGKVAEAMDAQALAEIEAESPGD